MTVLEAIRHHAAKGVPQVKSTFKKSMNSWCIHVPHHYLFSLVWKNFFLQQWSIIQGLLDAYFILMIQSLTDCLEIHIALFANHGSILDRPLFDSSWADIRNC